MRYANLYKRNTSKFHVTMKRLATVSVLSLALTSFVVLPLTNKASNYQASNNNQIAEIANDYEVINDAEM